MKSETERVAEHAGHPGRWFPWDLELARLQATHTIRPWSVTGPTPAEVWGARPRITSEQRAAFRVTLQALDGVPEGEFAWRAVQHAAVSRALVVHGYLSLTWMLVHPPISTVRTAGVSMQHRSSEGWH